MFNLFDKTHFKCCFCVLHSLTFKALYVFVSHAWVCVFVHVWTIMCVKDHLMHIWRFYSVFSCMECLIKAVRDVFFPGDSKRTISNQVNDKSSRSGESSINPRTVIPELWQLLWPAGNCQVNCNQMHFSGFIYMLIFRYVCWAELQNEHVCHDRTKCLVCVWLYVCCVSCTIVV